MIGLWGALLVACTGSGRVPLTPGGDDSGAGTCDTPLTCEAEALTAVCTAPRTAVQVGAAACPDAEITDDAPAEGFEVGTTAVTFQDTATGQTCTTQVTVVDEAPPAVDCPETMVLVSPDGAPVAAPTDILASDDCAEALDVQPAPAVVGVGVAEVVYAAADDAGNVGSCTSEVTVRDGRPPEGLQVLSADWLESSDTTRLTLGWDVSPSPDVTGYRVEQADDSAGPWASVDLLDADEVLLDQLEVPGDGAFFRLVSVVGDQDGGATAALRVHAIRADDYDLREVAVAGIPFDTTLYGVIRHPADLSAGPYPLVVLLHGNHGNCRQTGTTNDYCVTTEDHDCHYSGYETTPNAEGMVFQADTLAAQGYIAVTISGNAVNCRDRYISERAALIAGHLQAWRDWEAEDSGSAYAGAVDLSRVGLVGHSRGGEAVSAVPALLAASPIEGVEVRSVFAIAPTDYIAPSVAGVPYAVVLPACDGDVYTLVGRDIYDRSARLDDGVVRAQALAVGANHNYFSTEWSSDDGYRICDTATRMGKQGQQAWLEATLGPWFAATLDGADLRHDIRAEGQSPPSVAAWADRDLDVRWSYASDTRLLIDDLEGTGAPGQNDLGQPNTFTDFAQSNACQQYTCDSYFPHDLGAMYLRWDTGSAARAAWSLGGLDGTGYQMLSFRVVSRYSSWNTGRSEQTFRIVVTDADGDAASLPVSDVQPIAHLYPLASIYYLQEILQTVRVPLADLVALNPDFDPDALAELALEFDTDGDRGSILVTDIELAE